jgi:hypothetical protein
VCCRPKDCNRPDCGELRTECDELRTKNEWSAKKIHDLVEANIEKYQHMVAFQAEINDLKDYQTQFKMALEEEFEKAKLEWKTEHERVTGEKERLSMENDKLREKLEALEKEHSEQMKYVEAENADLERQIVDTTKIQAENYNLREENRKLKENEKEHLTQLDYAEVTNSRLEEDNAKLEQLKEKYEEEREKSKTADDDYARHLEYLEKKLEQKEVEIEKHDAAIVEKDNEIKKKDRQIQDLHDSQERSGNEFKQYESQISSLEVDLAKVRREKEALKEQVRAEKLEAKIARNDLDDHVKNTRDVALLLQRRNEEVQRLTAELDPLKEQLQGTEELRMELNTARQTIASLSAVLDKVQKGQNPEFKQDPDAYRVPDTGGIDSGDESVDGADDGATAVLKKKRSLDEELGTASADHESHYSGDPIDRNGNEHAQGPRNAFTQFIFKTAQIAVPGPEVVVQVPTPGPQVPVAGPTRYVPFRVWAHHPIVCWLLVEYNFLMLVVYWISRVIAFGKRLGLKVLGRAAAPAGSWLSDASESSEPDDLDGDGVRFPPRRSSSLQRGLWDDLLRPRPGRLPSVFDTILGLLFHIVVYAAVWMSYSAYQERQLWLAANDTTRRYLHQILHDHQSDGFLGLKQLVPRGVQRKFVQWRFILFMKAGFPATYRFPG